MVPQWLLLFTIFGPIAVAGIVGGIGASLYCLALTKRMDHQWPKPQNDWGHADNQLMIAAYRKRNIWKCVAWLCWSLFSWLPLTLSITGGLSMVGFGTNETRVTVGAWCGVFALILLCFFFGRKLYKTYRQDRLIGQ